MIKTKTDYMEAVKDVTNMVKSIYPNRPKSETQVKKTLITNDTQHFPIYACLSLRKIPLKDEKFNSRTPLNSLKEIISPTIRLKSTNQFLITLSFSPT